jgi:hypothetical protein
MPESKGRKREVGYQGPAAPGERRMARIGSPSWLAPTMVACFVLGMLYIVVFYIAGSQIPVMKDLSPLINVGIGFGFIIVGFVLATRWR